MIIIQRFLEYLSMRKLRLRAFQIAALTSNPNVTVYPREMTFEGPPCRVFVLTPHADDETFGAGGTILRHIAHGDTVEVLLFSDNTASIEGLNLSDDRKEKKREAEFDSAMHILGVAKWLPLRIGNTAFKNSVYPERAFSLLIENEPDVLYLPSLFDNHNDHRVLNDWLLRTLREHTSFRPIVRGFEVWSPLPATAVSDITGQIDLKRKAMRCYESQQDAVDYLHHIEGLNAYRAMTLGGRRARYAEAFLELPADVYLELGNSYLSS
jgi:LmbE family N-acetylglucosaminyl deacetylase